MLQAEACSVLAADGAHSPSYSQGIAVLHQDWQAGLEWDLCQRVYALRDVEMDDQHLRAILAVPFASRSLSYLVRRVCRSSRGQQLLQPLDTSADAAVCSQLHRGTNISSRRHDHRTGSIADAALCNQLRKGLALSSRQHKHATAGGA